MLSGTQINFRIEILPKFHNLLGRLMGRWKKLIFKTLIFENFWGPHWSNFQNLIISFEDVDSLAKTFLILYPPFENSTTRIVILNTYRIANSNKEKAFGNRLVLTSTRFRLKKNFKLSTYVPGHA